MNFNLNSSEETKAQTKVGSCEFALVSCESSKFRVMKWQNGNFSTLLTTRSENEAESQFDSAVQMAKDFI